MSSASAISPLGAIGAKAFLRDYWQKKPLLIRGAFPALPDIVTRASLFRLAGHEDCHARLVWREGKRWNMTLGPLDQAAFRRLGDSRWTVLVQDINHVVPAAERLLRQFDFIPFARLDDIMASYATRGGGVGAHYDSYDVFLLQGVGRRRWQISQQRDLALLPHAPLKILRRFTPRTQWVLERGDMLYLPPGVAHCGTALDDCITYSIGFRAPAAQQLIHAFLDFLHDEISTDGQVRDPDLRRQRHPGAISAPMLARCTALLRSVDWNAAQVRRFIGQYLSEPKAQVFFLPPEAPLARAKFLRRVERHGVVLSPKTRLLYRGRDFFVNGEYYRIASPHAAQLLAQMADRRALRAVKAAPEAAISMLHEWYRRGYLVIDNEGSAR